MEEKRATDWHLEATNENDTNENNQVVVASTHLFNCILDFANAAILIEREIRCHGLCDNSQDVVPKSNGRTHHDMWASMKSVSHFNLGIALELMLKLLLKLNDKGYEHIHGLAALLKELPSPVLDRLETTYQDCRSVLPGGYELVAFITKPPPAPSSPLNHDLATLKDFFDYFDEDVRLSTKRYSHELIEQEEWRHYLKDLSVFIELIDRVMGNIGRYIDPAASAENEVTGKGEQGDESASKMGNQ